MCTGLSKRRKIRNRKQTREKKASTKLRKEGTEEKENYDLR
jgi:hypothetical protein